MSLRRYALLMALASLVAAAALNIAVWVVTPSLRLDVTEDRRFALSAPTRAMLRELSEPIDVTFYFSRESARGRPTLARHAGQVRQMLAAFSAASGGRVRVRELAADRLSAAEDAAIAAGLEPIRPGPGARGVYLGLEALNAVNERAVIPVLAPERAAQMEADIARLIARLDEGGRLRVASISTLGAPALQALNRNAAVLTLAPGFGTIPESVQAVAALHPWTLSEPEIAALDAFLARGGRALIAVDPAARLAAPPETDDPFAVYATPLPARSDLAALFEAWGVSLSRGALAPAAGWPPIVPAAAIAPDPALSGIDRLLLSAPGALRLAPRAGLEATPLLRAPADAIEISAQDALAAGRPAAPTGAPAPAAAPEAIVGVRLTGALPRLPGFAPGAPATVIVLADADVLTTAEGAQFVAQTLAGFGPPDPLAAIPAGRGFARPLTRVLAMRDAAATEAARARDAAAAALSVTEAELAAVEARSDGGPDALAQIARLRAEALTLRGALRDADRALMARLQGLATTVTIVNLAAGPLLLALLAAGFFAWRRKRRIGDGP